MSVPKRGRPARLEISKEELERELETSSVRELARRWGMTRNNIYYHIKKLGVTPPTARHHGCGRRRRLDKISTGLWRRACSVCTMDEIILLTGESEADVRRKCASILTYPLTVYRRSRIPPREELMKLRYGQHMLISRIAEHYGYNKNAVKNWFRYHSIPKWTPQEVGAERVLRRKATRGHNTPYRQRWQRKHDEFWRDIGARHGYAPEAATRPCEKKTHGSGVRVNPSPEEIFWAIWRDIRSLRSVADEFGVSSHTLARWCRKNGIPYLSAAESIHLRALRRRVSMRTLRKDLRAHMKKKLQRELNRLWAEHGCEEWLNRRNAEETKAEI